MGRAPAGHPAPAPTRGHGGPPIARTAPTDTADLDAALRDAGFDRFRPGQREAVEALLAGRDVLGIMPTGAGKSLVYQLAARLLPGLTVVVSPLLALMRDQVGTLRERGEPVALLESGQSAREAQEELDRIADPSMRLLYVTPERFGNAEFMERMAGVDVSLFVVDEAHCISQWGHGFRPSYLELAGARNRVGARVTLAVTATAGPWVRREIVDRLEMRDPLVLTGDLDRPNLFLEVVRVEREGDKRRELKRLLLGDGSADGLPDPALAEAHRGSGIIYTATTRAARDTASWLRRAGVDADYYHGQRRASDRRRVEEAFLDGDLRVVVATNAFGLGIDKPDVRFVVHRDVPPSIEAYFQEVGRAGRDGAPARCTLLFRPQDLGRAAFLEGVGVLTREEAARGLAAMRALGPASVTAIAERADLGRADALRLVETLEDDGLARTRRGRVQLLRPDVDASRLRLDEEERRAAFTRSRIEMTRALADTDGCRRALVLSYLGDTDPPDPCGMCDSDLRDRSGDGDGDAVDTGVAAGARVVHETLGEGVVQRVEPTKLLVLFDREGYVTLDSALVRDQGLLRAA